MNESLNYYDYVVIGASVSGNIFCQNIGSDKKILMIDAKSYGRNKVCSGIQFKYLDKLLGYDIPEDIFCTNEINRMEFITNNNRLNLPYRVLNFHRSKFDAFLTDVTRKHLNIEIHHNEKMNDLVQENNYIIVKTDKGEYKTNIVVDASGLRSPLRKNDTNEIGGSMNTYIKVESSDLDENTLYQFYTNHSNAMFSWIYFKDDLLCVGNGSRNMQFVNNSRSFRKFVMNKYNVKGDIIKEEGYYSPILPVKLRENNVFYIGDSAGLVNLNRGVGIDIAIKSSLNLARMMNKTNDVKIIEKQYRKSMNAEIKSATKIIKKNISIFDLLRRGICIGRKFLTNQFLSPHNYQLY